MTAPVPLRAPQFWWKKPGPLAALLYPVAAIYGSVAGARLSRPGYRSKIPVICIGNPTLGGSGKTPTAISIAKMLKAEGKRIFFLTRGYGGSEQGPLLLDPAKHTSGEVGDEAPLLAAIAPTVVAHDRAAGAKFAEAQGAEIIVMDDGFQNPSLEKNFSLLVIDGARGLGNGLVFPAGPLRAPLDPQFKHAHAVVIAGGGEAGDTAAALASESGLPALRAKLVADANSALEVSGKRVLAFAGIGAPEKFFASLEAAGAQVAVRKPFGDHHGYSTEDAAALLKEARENSLLLVTTEKDLMRMKGDSVLRELYESAKALKVSLVFDDAAAIANLIGKSAHQD
jgi:tetraacyldisaccharide 4'-kinase